MSSTSTTQAAVPARRGGALRRLVAFIGADNLSLMFALVVLVLLVTVVSRWFGLEGGNKFFSWQNLMNSLAQAIVIVGLLAIGETVVIVAGALDISVGSIASVGSVVAASVLVGVGVGATLSFLPTGNVLIAVLAGIMAGALCGVLNGLIVTQLRVNPIIATLGTLAAFAGFAFLLAPEGKPVGVLTQPDFTWLAQGRFGISLAVPPLGGSKWTGIPVLTVILVIVAILVHIIMTYTDFGRAIYAIGGNATAARLAGINLSRVRILMYVLVRQHRRAGRRPPDGTHDFGQPGERHRPGAAGHHRGLPGWRRDGGRQGYHPRHLPGGDPGGRPQQRHEPARVQYIRPAHRPRFSARRGRGDLAVAPGARRVAPAPASRLRLKPHLRCQSGASAGDV